MGLGSHIQELWVGGYSETEVPPETGTPGRQRLSVSVVQKSSNSLTEKISAVPS